MITLNVRNLTTFDQKSKGLIGVDHIYPVYFSTRFGIHTFGVKYPLDILILDESFHIAIARQSLSPNQLFFWPPIHRHVVELPSGQIKKLNLYPGTQILLSFSN
jgi:uncharacterized membrane protein (UPF0127 family)